MTILEYISGLFAKKQKNVISWSELNAQIADTINEVWARELAFWSAVTLQSSALTQCEFRTYEGGKERTTGPEYYLWNVEPNRNQNRQEFLRELVAKLYRHNEALVIEWGDELLIADSYERVPYALYEDVFKSVTVKGFTFSRDFVQSEVLYFKLNSADVMSVVDSANAAYSRLLGYAINAYQKSRGTKGIFKYDALPPKGTEQEARFNELVNKRIGEWLKSDAAALPLGKGQEWQELQHKTYTNESTRDIRALVDDVLDFTCRAMGIPPALVRGDVAGIDDAIKLWLTVGIEPLASLLEAEINRKRYKYSDFRNGNRLEVYTGNIKHHDILDTAASIDKLIACGWSPNEVRRVCGEPTINEEWANRHYVTKNYAPTDEQGKEGNE